MQSTGQLNFFVPARAFESDVVAKIPVTRVTSTRIINLFDELDVSLKDFILILVLLVR